MREEDRYGRKRYTSTRSVLLQDIAVYGSARSHSCPMVSCLFIYSFIFRSNSIINLFEVRSGRNCRGFKDDVNMHRSVSKYTATTEFLSSVQWPQWRQAIMSVYLKKYTFFFSTYQINPWRILFFGPYTEISEGKKKNLWTTDSSGDSFHDINLRHYL